MIKSLSWQVQWNSLDIVFCLCSNRSVLVHCLFLSVRRLGFCFSFWRCIFLLKMSKKNARQRENQSFIRLELSRLVRTISFALSTERVHSFRSIEVHRICSTTNVSPFDRYLQVGWNFSRFIDQSISKYLMSRSNFVVRSNSTFSSLGDCWEKVRSIDFGEWTKLQHRQKALLICNRKEKHSVRRR